VPLFLFVGVGLYISWNVFLYHNVNFNKSLLNCLVKKKKNGYTCLFLETFFPFFGPLKHPFTLKWCLSLMLKCVSWMKQNDGSCFLFQSVNVNLFSVELRPLILRSVSCQCWHGFKLQMHIHVNSEHRHMLAFIYILAHVHILSATYCHILECIRIWHI
jgi:hypothetical protein